MKKNIKIPATFLAILATLGYLKSKNYTEITIQNILPYTSRVALHYDASGIQHIAFVKLRTGQQHTFAFKGDNANFSFHYAPIAEDDVEMRAYYGTIATPLADSLVHKFKTYSIWSDAAILDTIAANNLQSPERLSPANFNSIDTRTPWYGLRNRSKVFLKDPSFTINDEITALINAETINYSIHKEIRIASILSKSALLEEYNHTASITVVNSSPYRAQFVIHYAVSLWNRKTVGYYTLEAGEKVSLTQDFKGPAPSYQIHGISNDSELVAYLTDNKQTSIAFQDNEGPQHSVHPTEAFQYHYKVGTSPVGVTTAVAFSPPITTSRSLVADSYDSVYFLVDSSNTQLLTSSAELESDYLNDIVANAKSLNKSLKRQVNFLKEHKYTSCKYTLNLSAININDNYPGVYIDGINNYYNILGQYVQFAVGDNIVSINSEEIYNEIDLQALVHTAAVEKSIEEPLSFIIERDGELFEYQTTFHFNMNHPAFARNDENFRSSWRGFLDAISYGTDSYFVKLFSKEKGVAYVNSKYRLRYQYTNNFTMGLLVGSLASPARLALAKPFQKVFSKSIQSKALQNYLGTTSLEIMENSVYSFNNKHTLTSAESFANELKINAVFSSAIGVGVAGFQHFN